MLVSADGKISTGATGERDVDRDFPVKDGVREGLHQYYEIEQTTDLWSLNSGRVQAKLGVNTQELPDKTPVSFVIIDNRHLTEHGVRYFCARSREFVLVTSNAHHPAYDVQAENLHILYQRSLSLAGGLWLRENHRADRRYAQWAVAAGKAVGLRGYGGGSGFDRWSGYTHIDRRGVAAVAGTAVRSGRVGAAGMCGVGKFLSASAV